MPFVPTAFASHSSAARAHGVPIPPLPTEHVTVSDPNDRRPRDGVRCHVRPGAVLGRDVMIVGGVRVSSYARMFVELASLLSLVDLVVVGDNLVRRRKLTPAALITYSQESELPDGASALTAARYVRDRVDSPMESRLRMLIVLAGLPEPRVNHALRDETGHPTRRWDLSYERSRTIIEFEGRHHVEREETWEADLARREEIDDLGHRVIIVTGRGIYVHPEQTLLKIHRVLRERGEPGIPMRLSEAWRPHFPGRS